MKPSLHGFEFRFHKKVSNGYRSATKGLGSLLKADKGHSQVWKFVLVCCRVTSTSRHALGKENTVLTRCLKILTNIPKYETLMRQNPRRPLPAKASRVSKFPSALHAPRLIFRGDQNKSFEDVSHTLFQIQINRISVVFRKPNSSKSQSKSGRVHIHQEQRFPRCKGESY